MKSITLTIDISLLLCFAAENVPKGELKMNFLGKVGNKSFYSSMNSSAQMNWFDARAECSKFGFSLVQIETAEENDFLEAILRGLVEDHWVDAVLQVWNSSIFTWNGGSTIQSYINYYYDSNLARMCLTWFRVYNTYTQALCDTARGYALCSRVDE